MEKYVIINKNFNKAYINEKKESFLFLDKKSADSFCNKNPNAKKVDVSDKSFEEITSFCYFAGSEVLCIIDNKEIDKLYLNEIDLIPQYYNNKLNANLALLYSTQKKEYLKNFKDCKFIVAVVIRNNSKTSISYVTVKIQDDPYMYIAFTDLDEYKKWEEKYQKKAYPLEIDAVGLKRIGKKHGFIINPYGKRIKLTSNMLKSIKVEDDNEEEEILM